MKFTVDGEQYELDERHLTFGEGRAMERVTGVPLMKMRHLQKSGDVGLEHVQAMVWIAMRRRNPKLEFSDLDDRNIGDIEFGQETPAKDAAARPTKAAAPAAPAGSPT